MAEDESQSYYPSARVRLIIRFEDYGAPDVPKPPAKKAQLRAGNKDPGIDLEVFQLADKSYVLLGPGDDPDSMGGPQQQYASDDGRTQVIDAVIPITATLQRLGVRKASKLQMEIEYQDLPIDPRTVRACAVEYYLGTVSPEEFSRGIAGETSYDRVPGTEVALPLNIVPDEWVDEKGRRRTNNRFLGWVDLWDADWPEGELPVVRFDCTDNSALLADQDAPPQLGVGINDRIDSAVADYLSNFPQMRGLRVVYLPQGNGVVVPKLKDDVGAVKVAVSNTTKFVAVAGSGNSKVTVLDYLTDVVGSIGHMLRFDGVSVIIQRARTLYAGNVVGTNSEDEAFRGRTLTDGRVLDRRLMLYGRNILDMTFSRSFVKTSPFNVECRCYFPQRKKTLISRYPAADRRNKDLKPGNSSEEKWHVRYVQGIATQAALDLVAQNYYEQVGRNELAANITTKNLASFGGGNADPDLLDLRAGDDIDVEVLRDPTGANTVTAIQDEIKSAAAQHLMRLGYGSGFAAAYQRAVDNIGFPTIFKVRDATIDWDREEGVVIDLTAVNYVEIRADAVLPSDDEVPPDQEQTKPEEFRVEDNVR